MIFVTRPKLIWEEMSARAERSAADARRAISPAD
jgi:hypothetical protein